MNYAVEQLYRVKSRIIDLHDTQGKSWREIADMDEFRGVSHATLRDIAKGANPSRETCKVLGVRKSDRHRLHYECGRGETGREREAQLRAEMQAAGTESFTEYVDMLRGCDER